MEYETATVEIHPGAQEQRSRSKGQPGSVQIRTTASNM
jgi:hypothetical protein